MPNSGIFILPKQQPRDKAIERVVAVLRLLDTAKVWKVKIEVARKSRTDDQNNALWGCAYKFLREETGNDPQDMHDYFCGEYFGWVDRNIFGKRKRKPRRTTTTDGNGNRDVLSTFEFADFYSFIQQRMAEELGLNVPDPNPHWRERAAA